MADPLPDRHASWLAVAAAAALRACGVPSLVLGASFLGFGALVRKADLSLLQGLYSSATGWALPGQIALVELLSVGAPLVAIIAAVALTNARLLPMTVSLMPILRTSGTPRWLCYLAAHFIAVTGWAMAMRAAPEMPAEQRMPYFLGFTFVLWISSLLATALGFFLAGWVPTYVSLGLVFLNPIYFMLVFARDLADRARRLALLLGALAGPPLYLLTPEWSLLICGLAAGTLAFAADRLLARLA